MRGSEVIRLSVFFDHILQAEEQTGKHIPELLAEVKEEGISAVEINRTYLLEHPETLELLEELLASYSGTVLMVSHDREFLDNLVTTTLALEGDGQVREYVGGYTDWLRQRPEPVAAHTDKPKPKPLAPPAKIGPRKLTFKEQRELQMLKDELEALPGKMAALEDEQHTLEDRLNDPGFFARDPDGFNATAKRISELDDEQTAALQRWEDVEFRIAELEGKAEDK